MRWRGIPLESLGQSYGLVSNVDARGLAEADLAEDVPPELRAGLLLSLRALLRRELALDATESSAARRWALELGLVEHADFRWHSARSLCLIIVRAAESGWLSFVRPLSDKARARLLADRQARETALREASRLIDKLRLRAPSGLAYAGSIFVVSLPTQGRARQQAQGYSTLDDVQAKKLLSTLIADRSRPEGLRDELAQALALLERGLPIRVLRRRPEGRAPNDSDDAPVVTPSQAKRENETHWIEVQVEDEEGNPLAGISCEITLPDGSIVTQTSDDLGHIRVEDIARAGSCKLSLPQHDAEMWKTA